MRKILDVLRLSANGLSKRKIAASLGLSATAAGDCIRLAREASVAWPLAPELTDAALERLLCHAAPVEKRRPQPDWATVHRELKHAGRNAAAAVGRVSRDAPQWPRLQPLLSNIS